VYEATEVWARVFVFVFYAFLSYMRLFEFRSDFALCSSISTEFYRFRLVSKKFRAKGRGVFIGQ